ncbi:MAG: XRE family transcriptional regulator [Eubacteriales bacterium]|nr:XRE family transcriptional regulator [Eubacteriales bacterium]
MATLGDIIHRYRKDNGISMTDFSKTSGISKAYIGFLEKNVNPQTGSPIAPSIKIIKLAAQAMHVDFDELFNQIDGDVTLNSDKDSSAAARTPEDYGLTRLSDVHKKAIPMLGTVACGTPIYANEEHDSYVLADEDIDADYCLTARGDSMINARIYDGDLIFVKQCDHVENGEIAVVAIGDEVTLKRVYFYAETHTLQLIAENPKYAPLIYRDDELDGVYVIGKALFFQSLIQM